MRRQQQQSNGSFDYDEEPDAAPPPNPRRRLSTVVGAGPAAAPPASGRPKPGILRLDIGKPRRTSAGGGVEFRDQPQWLGETSSVASPPTAGCTSPHQLSVTWATPPYDFDEPPTAPPKRKPMPSSASSKAESQQQQQQQQHSTTATAPATTLSQREKSSSSRTAAAAAAAAAAEGSSGLVSPADTSGTPTQQPAEGDNNNGGDNNKSTEAEDDEDYSLSVTAIMQRRASAVRGHRGKRGSRSSSPMDPTVLDAAERRRSSVYTTSSEEGTNQESTQEQIFENIRLHKEVIQSVKLQPWPMRKKLKLVRQAKIYIARHEGALQERFAMSRSTRDLWVRFKMLMAARWRHWKRETASFLTVLIPWELRIKEIESHFGSGVASYFTFLRWLMWVNTMIAIPLVAFVIGPEYFATKQGEADPRKKMTDKESKVAGNLFTIWEFEGYLKYSPMFYGYYSNLSGASSLGYKLPLAYFLTALVVYIYSFVATLRKMAENSRNSKLSSKDDECTFSWKLFTGWDFMIGHAETAHNRIASVVVGFKEALLEEAEKKKDKRNWRIIMQRILVNILIAALLAASGYSVVALVNNADELARNYDSWLSRNAVNVTMTLLSFFLPMIFEALGLFENWHPRQQLRLQLARIMILNMLNLYSLMFSFIYKINSKEKPLQELKLKNETASRELDQLGTLIAALRSIGATTLGYDASLSTSLSLDDAGWASSSTTASSGASDDWLSSSTGSTDWSSSTTEALLTSTAAAVLSSVANRFRCRNITVRCTRPKRIGAGGGLSTALLLINLTTAPFMPPLTTESLPYFSSSLSSAAAATELWTTLPPTASTAQSTLYSSEESTMSSLGTTTEDADTTTPTEVFTTPPPTTSTSTPSPGNDSFFDYYDYFAGLPLPSELDTKAAEFEELPNSAQAADLRALSRQRRQLTTMASSEEPPEAPRISKYSSRRRAGSSTAASASDDDYADSSTVAATITTTASTTSTTSTTTTTTTTAPTTSTTTAATTTAAPPTATTEDASSTDSSATASLLRWENDPRLRKVLSYFTTSTTTGEPPTTHTPTTPNTPTTTPSTTAASETTLFFIPPDAIEDEGEPSYFELGALDEGNFEWCVRTVCDEVPGDDGYGSSTTEMDLSTLAGGDGALATTTLTPLEQHESRLRDVRNLLKEVQTNLTSMCWETSLGQELSKVIVFDGIMSIAAPLCIDFLRGLFVRYVNPNWCWDMEKTFPQYGDFKIAENILSLINNQGQVWMGIFFSPGLVLINLGKLMIMMYFRSWIVLTCNVPHEVVFKASKSNNFYLSLLLTMLFLCVLPVGYAIVWLRPSWHCGPFSQYNRISEFITNTTRNALPKELHEPLEYLTSSSTVIPLLLLLVLIIYYLISLTGALREANQDLRTQLQKEREEERKKFFKAPEAKPSEPAAGSITNRWRKVLEASSPVTPTSQPPDFDTDEYKNQARKELISRIMKKALRKGSATSDDDSVLRIGRDDDDTDNEHNDALPHDEDKESKEKRPQAGMSRLQQIRRTRKPSLVDLVQIAKTERARSPVTTPGAVPPPPPPIAAAGKEAHPKFRFKIEHRHEKREDEPPATPSPTPDNNENDPDTNSRIVNERRQSLLRRKREEAHEASAAERSPLPVDGAQPAEPQAEVATSNVTLINEKTKAPTAAGEAHSHQAPQQQQQHSDLAGLFKFKRLKMRPAASPEPEVFKFDEKTVEKSHAKLGRPVEPPTVPMLASPRSFEVPATPSSAAAPSSSSPSPSPSPTLTATLQRHAHPERLVNFSRQSRKKIGNLLALVREAVNTTKKGEDEPSPPHGDGVTTSSAPAGDTAMKAVDEHTTAIEMPPTPDTEKQATPPPAYTPAATPVAQPPKLHAMPPAAAQRPRALERPTPTITISTTGSEECIVDAGLHPHADNDVISVSTGLAPVAAAAAPNKDGTKENIIKINIEGD